MIVYRLDQFNDDKLVSSKLYKKLDKAMNEVQKEFPFDIPWTKVIYPEYISWSYSGLYIRYEITEHGVL